MVIHDTAEKLKKTREDSAPLSTLKERYAKKQKLMMNKTWEQLGARSGCPAGAAAAPAGGPLRSAPSHRFPVPTPRLGHRCRRFRLQQVRLPRPGSQRPSSLAVGAPAGHARPGGSEHGRALTWGGVRGGAPARRACAAQAPPRASGRGRWRGEEGEEEGEGQGEGTQRLPRPDCRAWGGPRPCIFGGLRGVSCSPRHEGGGRKRGRKVTRPEQVGRREGEAPGGL